MPSLDIASLTAEWVAVAITAAGLGSLVSQVGSLLDPFHENRGPECLGPWADDKDYLFHLYLKKGIPRGPIIEGKYIKGLCGLNEIHVSRKPFGPIGKASWTAILGIFHPTSLNPHLVRLQGKSTIPMNLDWRSRLPTRELKKHRDKACIRVSRTTFVTCLVLANAYQIYKYSGPAGLRVAYSGYTGSWEVQWPLGGSAEIEFFPLDSHEPAQEMHPPTFERRVDRCILMLIGIISGSAVGTVGFAEPKDAGQSILEFHKNGFPAHGKTTHLYNMMGGNIYKVHYLLRRSLEPTEELSHDPLKLSIPNPELDLNRKIVKRDPEQQSSILWVPAYEQSLLAAALDCLPWSPLGWSIHRGMQCILVAYGEAIMKAYRLSFARTLREVVNAYPEIFEAAGWNPIFVRNYMADTAAASVFMDGGDSGDVVRIVTAAARLLWTGTNQQLDETCFWRKQVAAVAAGSKVDIPVTTILEPDVVVALTKLFVLAWSNELDHKLYEDLPIEMLVA